ncbi:MAG: hypothetical protein JWM21_1666 [Acidobacteria bacterium]|nr:hypothetical protein [Acidobacteriota bacterium]
MQKRSARYIAVLVTILIILGSCFVDAGAQRRRKRRTRRVTSSVAQPAPSATPDEAADPSDPRVVSTADQSSTVSSRAVRPKPAPTPVPESDQEQLRRTINDLSGQLNKLTDKLNSMEGQQRSMVDLERLSRAEQRAETFRAQLRDVLAKEVDLQAQLDQVNFALQPENIERAVAIYGTTHPEVAREQRRTQLESQKSRLQAQYNQLEQSRIRLEGAITTADAEVDKLQQQIDLNNQQMNQAPIVTPPPTPGEAPPPNQ